MEKQTAAGEQEESVNSTESLSSPELSIIDQKSVLDIDISEVPKQEAFRYLLQLDGYIKEPAWALREEADRGRRPSTVDEASIGAIEGKLHQRALERMQAVAEDGPTFLTQKVAEAQLDSLLANFYKNDKQARRLNLMDLGLLAPDQPQVERFDNQQIEVISRGLEDHYGADRLKQRIDSWWTLTHYNFALKELQKLSDMGRLDLEEVKSDACFLTSLVKANIYSASNRINHLVYRLSDQDVAEKIDPYDYEMLAFGDMEQPSSHDAKLDPDRYQFHESFINFEKVNYRDIIRYGFQYSPVQIDKNRIGFFEEEGRLVQLYDLSKADPANPKSVTAFELADIVGDVFSGYKQEQKDEAQALFYQTACWLESRLAIEEALGERLDEFSLEDQILIVQLLNRSTPTQMAAIQNLGTETLLNTARALEFGDDFGDRLLTIAEDRPDDSSKIFKQVNSIRQLSGGVAEYFQGQSIDLSNEVAQAWIKRTTEVLAILADDSVTEADKQQAVDVLEILNFATEQIVQALGQDLVDSTDLSSTKNENNFVTLKSTNDVAITLRPRQVASESSQRIGFTVKIPKELIPEAVKGQKDRRLSLRLDYDSEGLSLDIGQHVSLDKSQKVSSIVGEVLSKGENLIGRTQNGYHVREAFESRANFSASDFEIMTNEFAAKLKLPDYESATLVPGQKEDTA